MRKKLTLLACIATSSLLTGCFEDKSKEIAASATEIVESSEAVTQSQPTELKIESATEVRADTKEQENLNNVEAGPKAFPMEFFAPLTEWVEFQKIELDPEHSLVDASMTKPVVVNFFWYGSRESDLVRPFFNDMVTNSNYTVMQYPAVFPSWDQHASLYYTFKELDILGEMHAKTFEAVHKNRSTLLQHEHVLNEFLVNNGIDAKSFKEVKNSPKVQQQVSKAKRVTEAYQLRSTPTIAVHYKGYAYITTPMMAGDVEKSVNTAKILMDKFIVDSN